MRGDFNRVRRFSESIPVLIMFLAFLAGCSQDYKAPFGSNSTLAATNFVRKEQFKYVGFLPATAKGKSAALIKMKYLANNGVLFLFTGSLNFSGKITVQETGTAAIGSLPGKLRVQLKYKSARGKVLLTDLFDLDIRSDGTIASQNFPLSDFRSLSIKEALELSVIPLDANLPESSVKLNMTYKPTSSAQALTAAKDDSADAEDIDLESSSESADRLLFSYFGFVPPSPRGKEQGFFRMSSKGGPQEPLEGKLKISGKIVPETPGAALPAEIQLIVRHQNKTGKTLSTDRFSVAVASTGKIALQSFPFTTENSSDIRESLQFSMAPVDRDLPFSTATVKIFYTR